MEFQDLTASFLTPEDLRAMMVDASIRAAIDLQGLNVNDYQLGFSDGMLAYSKAILDHMPVLLARAQAVALRKAGEA